MEGRPAPKCSSRLLSNRSRLHHLPRPHRQTRRAVAARNVTFGGAALTVLALTQDEIVGRTVLDLGVPYEMDSLAFMMDQVDPGSTVVDAGW